MELFICIKTVFFKVEQFWHLNYVPMLNLIVWNGTAFVYSTEIFEMELFWHLTVSKLKYTYAKLSCFDKNSLTKLNSLK